MWSFKIARSAEETKKSLPWLYPMAKLFLFMFFVTGTTLILSGCNQDLNSSPDTDIAPQNLFMFRPIHFAPPVTGVVLNRVNLGRRLYYDVHLSKNASLSCNSCHQLEHYGVDPGKALSLGYSGHPDYPRNTPTSYNAGLQFVQFWDGRAATLADQAGGPILNPAEMGMPNKAMVLSYINSQPGYVKLFHEAYPGSENPVTFDHITDAIQAFEQGLLTPSPWDRYLAGDTNALTEAQKQGLRVFLRSGCEACHAGADMGGNSYEQLGAVHNWPNRSDLGRAGITHLAGDDLYFKVPTLRNVAETGPWFQNGQVKSLKQAVRLMGYYQTGENLSNADVNSIVTFLHALTGTIPQQYIQEPEPFSSTEGRSDAFKKSLMVHTSQEVR